MVSLQNCELRETTLLYKVPSSGILTTKYGLTQIINQIFDNSYLVRYTILEKSLNILIVHSNVRIFPMTTYYPDNKVNKIKIKKFLWEGTDNLWQKEYDFVYSSILTNM